MPIPTPEPGLVISYAYLWHHEHEAGREEGRKDRPSVMVLAVERPANDTSVVVVLPITHTPPADPASLVQWKFRLRSNVISDLMRRVPGSLLQRATNSIGRAMIFGKSDAVIAMTMVSCRRDSSIK